MEAPEKIYLIRNFTTSTSLNTTNDHRGKYLQEWYKSREKDADVEYIRKDAFIEKACDAYCAICDTKECAGCAECSWVIKFRRQLLKY